MALFTLDSWVPKINAYVAYAPIYLEWAEGIQQRETQLWSSPSAIFRLKTYFSLLCLSSIFLLINPCNYHRYPCVQLITPIIHILYKLCTFPFIKGDHHFDKEKLILTFYNSFVFILILAFIYLHYTITHKIISFSTIPSLHHFRSIFFTLSLFISL
jgi:hypothetical protein